MAALHEALKSLGPSDFSDTPIDALGDFLSSAFDAGQTIVESVPIPAPSSSGPALDATRTRANTGASIASSASEISISSARATPPPAEIEALQKEWKAVKLNPKENPLGVSVYKLAGKDGRGSWFARRSVHEGLGFKKWKTALEREFPETLKVQGGPGEGNIRGIGGEERVEYQVVEGVGKLEVYLLSAQFPGPTAPRDFVTMFLTSDQALKTQNGEPAPRHFMIVSKPCNHPETPPREGYIRGQYESVEFIREIPVKKPRKSVSTTNLESSHTRNRSSTLGKEAILRSATKNHPGGIEEENEPRSSTDGGRARGRTISFDHSRGTEAKGEDVDIPREEEGEENPVEWIMITRSDPGGSVPRFLIDRGTPGGIVNDASKFLDWACANDFDDGTGEEHRPHEHSKDLHNYETNGHLAGLEEEPAQNSKPESKEVFPEYGEEPKQEGSNLGLYGLVSGGIGAAGGFIASHTPHLISDRLPGSPSNPTGNTTDHGASSNHNIDDATIRRRASSSSLSTVSSVNSFTSALENRATTQSIADSQQSSPSLAIKNTHLNGAEKELAKLEEKKRKLDEKLQAARLKETSRQSEDTAKEGEALRKATEKHEKEMKKQEEKYKKEVLKLQIKKEKEQRKAEERHRKAAEKDERVRLQRELEETRAEMLVLHKEKEILRFQVGELQRENTLLAARIGKMGGLGEEILREVKEEVGKGGRLRSATMRSTRPPGLGRRLTSSSVSLGGGSGSSSLEEKKKENVLPANGAAGGNTGA